MIEKIRCHICNSTPPTHINTRYLFGHQNKRLWHTYNIAILIHYCCIVSNNNLNKTRGSEIFIQISYILRKGFIISNVYPSIYPF